LTSQRFLLEGTVAGGFIANATLVLAAKLTRGLVVSQRSAVNQIEETARLTKGPTRGIGRAKPLRCVNSRGTIGVSLSQRSRGEGQKPKCYQYRRSKYGLEVSHRNTPWTPKTKDSIASAIALHTLDIVATSSPVADSYGPKLIEANLIKV
jgi:hypothetical protein